MKREKEYTYKWYLFGCRDAGYLHEKKNDAGLTFSERVLYYFHLLTCVLCRRYVRQMELIERFIKEITKHIYLDSNKKAEIQKSIEKKLSN